MIDVVEVERLLNFLAVVCEVNIKAPVLKFYIDELKNFEIEPLRVVLRYYAERRKFPSLHDIKLRLCPRPLPDTKDATTEPDNPIPNLDLNIRAWSGMVDVDCNSAAEIDSVEIDKRAIFETHNFRIMSVEKMIFNANQIVRLRFYLVKP